MLHCGFAVDHPDIATTDTFTFDLFKAIKDTNGTDNESNMSSADGTIIAPGIQGSFELVLTNASKTKRYKGDGK